MKVVFAYLPFKSGDGFITLSQNRFAKMRGDCELIYPMIPAAGVTLWSKEGYDVHYIDSVFEQYSEADFINRLTDIKPDLLVYEAKTPVIKQSWETVAKIKKSLPELKIAVCGDHVSVLPMESMENSQLDYVITGGDYDVSMLGLARHIDSEGELPKGVYYRKGGKILNTGSYELIADLDSLPDIDRDIIPWRHYHESWRLHDEFTYMMASRGCPYRCSFCSWPQMLYSNKVRFRSVDRVLDEMQSLVSDHGVREIFFDDDTFTCNRKWMIDFCEGIISRGINVVWSCNGRVDNVDKDILVKMRRAGCRLIKFGVESASPVTLERITKGYTIEQVRVGFKAAREAGIMRHGTVMLGYPWETLEDMRNTIEFIKEIDVDTVQFSIPIVYPGTRLFEEAKKEGWLRFAEGDWDKYDMSMPSLINPNVDASKIVSMCQSAWREVYFRPKFIWNKIVSVRSIPDIKLLYRGGMAVLKGHISSLRSKGDDLGCQA
ncbi:B12-binding domain-containing radical SAM protein [Candidatus Altiarchaeota archaeon]